MAKILIVDDDEETLTWMAAALESAGHVVRTGSSGRAALQVIEVWKPDLILSDVLMSEMDGFALSKLTRRRGIPTVFVSITKREAEAILHGVAGYVEKPVTAAELRAAVNRVLGDAPGGAILIVDDDPMVREIFRSVLEPRFSVLEAENGKRALEILEGQAVRLVITDIHMPVMNGVELVRAMRRDPRLCDLPVVVQSCDAAATRSPLWTDLRVARSMRKEDFIDWLLDQIDEELSGSPGGGAPARNPSRRAAAG